jgi:heterodisulfide reductase subunit C
MAGSSYSPEDVTSWLAAGRSLFLTLHAIGIACFVYIVIRRLEPMVRAQRDLRFDRPLARLGKVFQYWLGQWRHPRYPLAGTIHIAIFACFLMLVVRAFSVLLVGVSDAFAISGSAGRLYEFLTDYATTIVFVCMVVAAIRRTVFRPARYAVPARYGKGQAAEAIFLLGLIALLMVADSLFEAGKIAAEVRLGDTARSLAPLSLPWLFHQALGSVPLAALRNLYVGSYLLHALTFYFLLCYRPFGIQFHVETSLFTVFFAKLTKGTIKPVRWGVSDAELEEVKSFGVKRFEDFTWKHILDFYSCADCGRCSDNCPADAVGRPLSPRFISVKARDYAFEHFPVFGRSHNDAALIGGIYSADEIWSCTTCGACEQECPLLVEYIDKIVDLRRGMVDDGNVPQTLQKPLQVLESRGNPYGKL